MLLKIAALLMAGTISIYPNVGKIDYVDEKTDTFRIIDDAGDIWEMYGIEDFKVGDNVAMIMDTNGTENIIYDDIILSVRYLH